MQPVSIPEHRSTGRYWRRTYVAVHLPARSLKTSPSAAHWELINSCPERYHPDASIGRRNAPVLQRLVARYDSAVNAPAISLLLNSAATSTSVVPLTTVERVAGVAFSVVQQSLQALPVWTGTATGCSTRLQFTVSVEQFWQRFVQPFAYLVLPHANGAGSKVPADGEISYASRLSASSPVRVGMQTRRQVVPSLDLLGQPKNGTANKKTAKGKFKFDQADPHGGWEDVPPYPLTAAALFRAVEQIRVASGFSDEQLFQFSVVLGRMFTLLMNELDVLYAQKKTVPPMHSMFAGMPLNPALIGRQVAGVSVDSVPNPTSELDVPTHFHMALLAYRVIAMGPQPYARMLTELRCARLAANRGQKVAVPPYGTKLLSNCK